MRIFYFLTLILGCLANTFESCNSRSSCQSCDQFAELKQNLLLNYSQDTRPFLGKSSVNVTVQFLVMHLYDVNSEDQTYRITGYLRQYWNDPRLVYNYTKSPIDYLTFSKDNRIWLPDTFISNSIIHRDRQSQANDLNMGYHYIRVNPGGDVIYSQMIEMKVNSPMKLDYFPYHVVTLNIIFESYGYFSKDLVFKIHDDKDPLKFEKRTMNAPSFNIYTDRRFSNANIVKYDTGLFSSVTHYFKLIPVREKNILTILVPINLLIFVNWLAFWMPVTKMFGARISLGITALLADFALSFSLPIPITQHFMWINMYILISYAFICISLLAAYKENQYITKVYGHELMNTDKTTLEISQKLDHISDILSSNEEEVEKLEKERVINTIVIPCIDEILDNTIKDEEKKKGIFYRICEYIPFTTPWFNYESKGDRRQKHLDKLKLFKGESTDLLTQPYITHRRKNMRWYYFISWSLLNVTIIIFGELYVRILAFNE
jgi:hypothetical protein